MGMLQMDCGERQSALGVVRVITMLGCCLLGFSLAPAWANVTTDATISVDQGAAKSSVTTAAFSTLNSNELLLAFISTDYISGGNTTVTGVTGAGLTWQLVERTNVQSGTSEIWRAFAPQVLSGVTVKATLSHTVASSMTVMSFSGVDPSGTNGSGAIGAIASGNSKAGAPSATLVTTRDGSLVAGVGNDYTNAIARTPGPGQTVVHQNLSPTGDTYWVQMESALTPLSGTSVTINDTAPSGDEFNLSICEILAAPSGGATYTLSGAISPAAAAAATTVSLTGPVNQNVAANPSTGSYSFSGLPAGAYTVTPTSSAYTFNPPNQTITISTASVSGVNFTAQAITWSISGAISPTAAISGTTVNLTGPATANVSPNPTSGAYTFTGLSNGTYTVTPSNPGYTFNPPSQNITVNGANASGVNFSGAVVTWSITGVISPVQGGANATVTLSGSGSAVTTTDGSGNYQFANLSNGSYTVTPSNSGYKFVPPSAPVVIAGANQQGVNFQAQSNGPTYTVSGTISPTAAGNGATVSVSGSATFSVIADTSGNYSLNLGNGTYTVTPSQTGYTFTPPNQTVVVNGASQPGINFVGNTTQSTITPDVTTTKDGSTASTSIATNAFSTTAGGELLLAFVATDYLSGANTTVTGVSGGGLTWSLVVRSNTQPGDAEIWQAVAPSPLSNVTVTATLSQKVEALLTVMSFKGVSIPTAIGAIASEGSVSGAPSATLVTKGSNSWVLGVGNDYENATQRTPGPNQSVVSQFLTSLGDTYWVQEQNGAIPSSGTSVSINDTAPARDMFNVAAVEILAGQGVSDTTPPTVSMAAPAPGVTAGNLLTVWANASDNVAVAGVQLILDGAPFGSQITTPPYSITWDTSTVSSGTHTWAAQAVDSSGNTATSSPVSFTVDNSGNPAVVGSWSSAVSLPAVAVNLILLQNNQVLFYQDGTTPTVWNYVSNTFTS
ncbi:MAG TPA: carboxypeptidase regulatory-like domain-containing protein, partial [Blastocatellia bacterium]|nr:carboxypeptidase regulatory-like domain-containing protein [Blastocatellia bacterium]